MKENKLLKIQCLVILTVMVLQILIPIFPLSIISRAEGQEVESVQEIAGSGTQEDRWKIGKNNPEDVTAYIEGTTLYIKGTGETMDFYVRKSLGKCK